jgi:hypothetical protein
LDVFDPADGARIDSALLEFAPVEGDAVVQPLNGLAEFFALEFGRLLRAFRLELFIPVLHCAFLCEFQIE